MNFVTPELRGSQIIMRIKGCAVEMKLIHVRWYHKLFDRISLRKKSKMFQPIGAINVLIGIDGHGRPEIRLG